MPQIVRGACPGMGDDAEGCFVAAGEADYTGTPWPPAPCSPTATASRRAHELGHAFDATMMDAGERERFVRLTGMFADDEYWASTYVDDEGPPARRGRVTRRGLRGRLRVLPDRADHRIRARVETSTGYQPTAHVERVICGMIMRAGRDRGTPVDADGYR
jgi:hypothetical protein